jgi:murein DD-endopeptidase MepM/ murein hydrolase activator NlpD
MASRKTASRSSAPRARATALLRELSPWLARPGVRLGLIGGLCAVVVLVMSLDTAPPPELHQAESSPQETADTGLDLPVVEDGAVGVTSIPVDPVADVAEPAPTPERAWDYVQVASGDTLEVIFRRMGLSPGLLHRVVTLDEHGRSLADLRPGDELAFDIADDGFFHALRAEKDDEHWLFIEAVRDDSDDVALSSRLEPRNLETRIVEVEAEINSSLFNAGKNVGLSDNMLLRLANIFGWDIDFALDIRRGDRFALVFEEIYRDGQFLRQGAILAARFVNQGDTFQAVRFDAGNGPDYYDPQGRPMRKAFLRTPLNFARVSSNFNPRRLHPVTRRMRPHNGTDYAAPVGTPIWAAGDGTVIEAGYTRPNGNYIFIQHGNHIVTRYLHLSRKDVQRGDRVRQGQTIGAVGATGLVTGPHLHYEFLVNGRHRDPRTVDLPEAVPLPADLLPSYQEHAAPYLARLDRLIPGDVMLASAGDAEAAPPGSD